ncbi:MAG: hypothetical protein L6Q63_17530 [Giesbergeria sp.]|nr:hypothetical protein [Giesbergeria sp.]
MMAPVYQHPDGHEITVGYGLLTACTSEGTAVSLPIGLAGLRDVAAKLLALADAGAAERAGAELGHDLLAELLALRGSTQADALRPVHDKLQALHKLEHFDAAAGGFAVALVPVLVLGIANIPNVEGCK